jgi:hypothetical protein
MGDAVKNWPVTLWLEGITPPSNNVLTRMHFQAYGRLRELWRETLAYSMDATRDADKRLLLASAEEKIPLRIEILVFRHRLLDEDNLTGGVKPVLDALKVSKNGLGWICGDSPDLCKLLVRQERDKRQGTEITFWPKSMHDSDWVRVY